MKKVLALTLSLLMVLTFCVGCGGGSDSGADGDTIKIGVFEPASGDNGAGGKQETLGIQYGNKVQPTVTIGDKEYNVELEIVDNESDNSKAVTAAQNLVSSGVSMVLGSYGSAVSIAAADTFHEAGVPAIGVTCTNPQVTADCDEYFRICFLDPFQGTVLANYAWESGMKKAYCLSKLGDDYSVGLVNYFKKAFTALGGEVVEEQFPDKNTDFTSYVANAKKKGCDVFYSPVSIEAAVNIIDQAKAQKIGMPILAGDTWDSNMVTAAAKGTDLDIVVTTFYQEGGNPEFDEGIKAWMEEDSDALTNNGGNTDLAAVTAMGYDAYMVALEALKAAGSADPADVLAALPSLEVKGLVCGDVTFNETGDANKTEAFVKKCNCEKGVWEFVKKQSAN
ncbi:MAG: ABC transporter substrate-binding protein [Clostridiales bacterium]|nr:ABC transporter substrate-binding protein [Candidatus Crickella equi]